MSVKQDKKELVYFAPALNQMLEKAHQMLTAIGIPVADVDQIEICIHSDPQKPHVGWCIQDAIDPEKFHIFLHVLALQERTPDHDRSEIFRSILHELTHTACLDKTGKMKVNHGPDFFRYAEMVKEAYGYELRTCMMPSSYPYIHQGPLYEYRCACGALHQWYDVPFWEKTQHTYEKGGYYVCPYCNRRIELPGEAKKKSSRVTPA